MAATKHRVFVVGATGYIGRFVVAELIARGHEVVAFVRSAPQNDEMLAGAQLRVGVVTDPTSIAQQGVRGEHFDTVVSCLASRTGGAQDAWSIERDANLNVLKALQGGGASHFVLCSAICVQRPKLEFQRAKLAFEAALVDSGLRYSIVRPTAFFKSLSGQVQRVKDGKPFVVFGDGELTACKPIGERDLARFIADCLHDPDKHDAILPVGGPGPAVTPRQQGELLFSLVGRPPKFRHVPVRMMDMVIGALSVAGRVVPSMRDKAEFARIGRYYATESMLVFDPQRGEYDELATPSYGVETLRDHYAHVIAHGLAGHELREHAVF